jgi:hypothetical protein
MHGRLPVGFREPRSAVSVGAYAAVGAGARLLVGQAAGCASHLGYHVGWVGAHVVRRRREPGGVEVGAGARVPPRESTAGPRRRTRRRR